MRAINKVIKKIAGQTQYKLTLKILTLAFTKFFQS